MTSAGIVFAKELRDILRRPSLIGTMILPFVLLTAMAVLALYASGLAHPSVHVPSGLHLPPSMAGASRSEVAQYLTLGPFILIWLIIPISVASTLAAYAIVGEKEEGTLEPLLATPIGTGELLLGKVLAAGLPGLGLVWVSWLITLGAGLALHAGRVVKATLWSPSWLAALAVLAPGLTFLTVMLLVVISSRVNDVRTANQIGALLVLPIVMGFVTQVSRGVALGVTTVGWISLGVWLAGLGALAIAVRVFQRESILVRWKQSR